MQTQPSDTLSNWWLAQAFPVINISYRALGKRIQLSALSFYLFIYFSLYNTSKVKTVLSRREIPVFTSNYKLPTETV